MKVIYDNKQEMYLIVIEESETETWINTSDIVEAKKEFTERMAWMFNNAIAEKLKEN